MLLFGEAKALAGVSQVTVFLSSSQCLPRDIVNALCTAVPVLQPLLESKTCMLAINHEYVSLDDDRLVDVENAEIAFIPPIGGG